MVDQSRDETGDYTSNFFINDNNAFGYAAVEGAYWQDGSSDTVADNGQLAAHYSSVANSAREIVDWLYRRGATYQQLAAMSLSDYVAYLLSDPEHEYFGVSQSVYYSALSAYDNSFAGSSLLSSAASAIVSMSPLEAIAIVAAIYFAYELA